MAKPWKEKIAEWKNYYKDEVSKWNAATVRNPDDEVVSKERDYCTSKIRKCKVAAAIMFIIGIGGIVAGGLGWANNFMQMLNVQSDQFRQNALYFSVIMIVGLIFILIAKHFISKSKFYKREKIMINGQINEQLRKY